MKKLFSRTLALILALATVLSICTFANALSCGYADWTLDEETGHLTVYSNVPYNDRFQDSEFFRLRNEIKSVSFVDGVTAIEKNAFRNCINIESIELPRTLEFIGPWAFASCKALKSIELPGSLTYIGTYSFSGCAELKEIVIPPKVTVVSECAFANCIGLESAEIMNSETFICDEVFSRCKGLKNVRIPEKAQINSQAFFWCENIENVYYCGDKESFNALEINTAEDRWFYCSKVYFNQPAAVYPVEISAASMPQKTAYKVGEALDLTGFALSVEMNNGTTQTLSDLSQMYIHGFDSTCTREDSITVEYYGYKINIPYSVFKDPAGVCGDGLTWLLDIREKTLTISGNGEMYSYSINKTAPWAKYSSYIRTVEIENGVKSIGTRAFGDCTELESVYYSGTLDEWKNVTGQKNMLREVNLYLNGELHEHLFEDSVRLREPTCRRNGSDRYFCECGDYNDEILPPADHTPGEWQSDGSDKLIKVCTGCKLILETKEKEPADLPDKETTQPAEPEQEEPTMPEAEKTPDENIDEPAEKPSVFEQITEVFEKIADIFEDIFGFFSKLFNF